MARKPKMFGIVVTAFLAAISSFWQGQTDNATNNRILHEKLDPIIKRSGIKVAEAPEFVHEKRFPAAEAACLAAIEICSDAPFLQVPIKKVLANVYLSEGHFEESLGILEPLYNPKERSFEYVPWLAIDYARLGKPEKGVRALQIYATPTSNLYFAPNFSDLPVAESETSSNVEATALLIWSWIAGDPIHPEDAIARLRRAAELAPKNPAVNFALAKRLDSQNDWKGALPHYLIAYAGGNEQIRKGSRYRLQQHDIKLDDNAQNSASGG